ncbi:MULTISPECIES: porin [Pandoraea]|jgi:predicted porin|nr:MULTISPECIES: porin [Pandoraea]MBN9095424.1 porin [Pandoraea pnomenusa]QDH59157.1 porin [Pandoraea pnomenusa]QDX21111.1 porin [Pandoraea pnomenusa]
MMNTWHKLAGAAALSAAVLAPAAHAQSSVNFYGLADAYVGSVKNPGGNAAVVQQGGGMTTSFWGLSGNEDLGGGNHALFVIESYFQPNNGTYGRFAGDSFFSRNAYVGLSNGAGTLRLGRITTPLYLATIQFNPFNNSYTFSPMIFHTYKGLGTQGVVGDSAWNNAIAYTSPAFAGLTGTLLYATGNSAADHSAKKWGAALNYSNGPFAAAFNYQYVNFSATPGDFGSQLPGVTGLTNQNTAQLGLSYDFAVVKVFAQYMLVASQAASGNFHANTGQLGASVPLGRGSVLASVAYTGSNGSGDNQRRTTWALGYDYPLSKRTDIYAAYKYDHMSDMSTGQTYGAGLRMKF